MMMISKMHALLLSVFSLFKFHLLIHNFIKSWAVASIPGFFVCICCAAMNPCLANNILGISSRIQLLFSPADAASMLFSGDTVISGICVALALCIAVPRSSKNRFFNYTFLRHTVNLTVIIIIMNWFQSAQGGGQPALQYVASGVIGFVAVHCLWNVEVKQPMSEVWDWNMYGTKLKFHGWFLNTANENGDGGEDDATYTANENGDGCEDDATYTANENGDGYIANEDGDGGEDDATYTANENGDGYIANEDGDGGEDDATFALEYCEDEIMSCGRAVQLLAIRANFRICAINAWDWNSKRSIYSALEGEVQEEGKDLVLTGPCRMLQAYGSMGLEVFVADDLGPRTGHIIEGWDVTEPDEVEEFTQTIYGVLGRKLEITYLVIPEAVETYVEVRLNLKDLGSRSRAVYGSVKARAKAYGSKSVHLFSRERGSSLSLPCGSTSILPLSPYIIALPDWQHFKLHIEVDLRVITTCDSQEEDKSLKFCLDCSRRNRSEERLDFRPRRRIRSQKREVDGDQVEVDVNWRLERRF